ncbi:halocyanin domain-containing protein [Halorhabdus amylolytica]|uniref:halocyanin domain-containing protein n=1 Tax=Halorhabdus amylolytica TaxID=2559573 RepID=UPI0010AA6958|nr:halocyanin domain-containing protein [Halorhabdus amylolytica]
MERRRQFLSTLGAGLAVGSLAGCSSGSSTETESQYPEYTDIPASVEEYLSNTSNFDGTGVDRTDADEVSVTVGAQGNGANYAFDPAVAAVSQGTTVVWEWNGRGGAHNVVSKDDRDPLDSGTAITSSSETYEHTFEEPGAYLYVCIPHRINGMKGAIIVE